ncbi:hypothetical protein EDB82DRAFT_473501 [Fusarium venenatum]|uniref:uncharacterized protein n=1 Tax=Fusarium venenatum TaxID=56646 RepID=UPI001D7AFE2C|nr:hypothetical protein EDB82DRAFT_473501 [Fusarium venenatum]
MTSPSESSSLILSGASSTAFASTTTEATTVAEPISTETATTEDNASINSDIETTAAETTINANTSIDSDATIADTTTALPTTTNGAVYTCSDLDGSYTTSTGDVFTVACNKAYYGISTLVDPFEVDSFTSCIDTCSGRVVCEAVDYKRDERMCYLFACDGNVVLDINFEYDVAFRSGTEP